MTEIHIACQSTSQFAPDCGVMLHSLLSENQDDSFVIHFLHDESIAATDLERLSEIARGFGAQWAPQTVTTEMTSGFPVMERYGGLTVWFRLLLPRLLENVRRVLYLDADLLIVGPVRPLWETGLSGRCLAAVTQPLIRPIRRRVVRELGLPDPGRYFNTGVMVMDLERLRSSGLMLEAERVPREGVVPVPWADQDSLNVALWQERLDLHPRWNLMNPCYEFPARVLPWTPQQIREAVARPAIIHFIGSYKPWHHRLRHPWTDRYFEHLAQTPWRDRPIEGRTARNQVLRTLPPPVATRYETLEYAIYRARRAARPTAFRLVQGGLGRHPHLYGIARTGYRAIARRPPGRTMSDVLDALDQSHRDGVCFVQIGSNDADWGDPLRPYLEGRSWRGVMVEPVPFVFERLRARYGVTERISLVNAAVAADDGSLPFYYVAESDDPDLPEWYDKLGSLAVENILHPYHVENIPDLADRIVCEEVRAVTFETLWREHPLPRLDLLHIDAEGFDDQILAQIELMRHRPNVVIYEQQHLPGERRVAVEDRLRRHGYRLLDLGPDALAYHREAPLPVRLIARNHRRAS